MESLNVNSALPPVPAPPGGNPRRKLYIGLGIAAAVVILGGFIALAVSGVRLLVGAMKQPADALSIYTGALIQKDYQSAYALASADFRAALSQQGLIDYHAKLTDRLGALKSVKQTNWEINTNNGVTKSTIETTVQFERGSEPFEFVLLEEQGTWRVLSYKELNTAGVE